jgi:MFS family permease
VPEFVQTPTAAGYGFGASITRSGLMLLPSAVTMFIVGLFAGRLARRLGGRTLVIAGCLIGCGAMSMLAFAHHHQLTSRAVSAGTVNPGITTDDVITLISAMRGLIHTVPGGTPDAWQRFLDLHLAGMTAPQLFLARVKRGRFDVLSDELPSDAERARRSKRLRSRSDRLRRGTYRMTR